MLTVFIPLKQLLFMGYEESEQELLINGEESGNLSEMAIPVFAI